MSGKTLIVQYLDSMGATGCIPDFHINSASVYRNSDGKAIVDWSTVALRHIARAMVFGPAGHLAFDNNGPEIVFSEAQQAVMLNAKRWLGITD